MLLILVSLNFLHSPSTFSVCTELFNNVLQYVTSLSIELNSFLLPLDRVFETSQRFGFSTRSLGHVIFSPISLSMFERVIASLLHWICTVLIMLNKIQFSSCSWAMLFATVLQWRDVTQLLIIPLTVYSGLQQAFFFGDIVQVR